MHSKKQKSYACIVLFIHRKIFKSGMGTQILENYLVGLLKVGKSKIRRSQSYRVVFETYSERERIRAPAEVLFEAT